jgi:hypothetical protein
MAGHLPVKKSGFPRVISNNFKMEHIKKLEYFKKEKCLGYNIQRLPVSEYAMDEEHGKVDEEVLSFWKEGVAEEKVYEIHFDKDMKINEVYLVM